MYVLESDWREVRLLFFQIARLVYLLFSNFWFKNHNAEITRHTEIPLQFATRLSRNVKTRCFFSISKKEDCEALNKQGEVIGFEGLSNH